jgi:general secretion pathway protein G
MMRRAAKTTRAFSLVELVIVVVIMGIIAAIAVPRLTSASANAGIAAMNGDLTVLMKAIEHYAAEHGETYPNADKVSAQLTQFSDLDGNTTAQRDATHVYGPYVRSIPPLPYGPNKGNRLLAKAKGAGVGWLYLPTSGRVLPNLYVGSVMPMIWTEKLDVSVSERISLAISGTLPP